MADPGGTYSLQLLEPLNYPPKLDCYILSIITYRSIDSRIAKKVAGLSFLSRLFRLQQSYCLIFSLKKTSKRREKFYFSSFRVFLSFPAAPLWGSKLKAIYHLTQLKHLDKEKKAVKQNSLLLNITSQPQKNKWLPWIRHDMTESCSRHHIILVQSAHISHLEPLGSPFFPVLCLSFILSN